MSFEFIADRAVLDFVATLSERGTSDLDRLRTPADLVAWVQGSGLVDDDVRCSRAALLQAKALREALFATIAARIDDRPVPDDAGRLVNAAAARPAIRPELDPTGRVRRRGDLDAVLAALAVDALDLVAGPDHELLRWCDDARCTRPFVDRSRGRRRRWCGRKGCGDRAKAAAYRARRRAPDASDRAGAVSS